MLEPIDGALRDYAWGKPDGVSEVLGRDLGAADSLEAEYWLSSGTVLAKVLAAAQPLSLQVHPDAKLAAEGFERESAAGVPLDAPERSFKDRAAKAELILALSDRFEALAGFRPAATSRERFEELAAAAEVDASKLLDLLADDSTVGDGFLWLISGSDAARSLVDTLTPVIASQPEAFPAQQPMLELYPSDPGVLASVLMNHVVLERGEVLAIEPGTIHAYLAGTGLELMVESDNVLRGGLTPKHIDIEQLGRALRRAASEPIRIAPSPIDGGLDHRFALADGGALALAALTGDGRAGLGGPAIVLCLEGEWELHAGGESARISRGEAMRVEGAESVEARGRGRLYIAR